MSKNYKRSMLCIGILLAVLGLISAALGLCTEKGWLMPAAPAWYSVVCFSLAAVALFALLALLALVFSSKHEKRKTLLVFRLIFSDFLLEKTAAKRVAYIGVVAALCIVSNMFEIKFATTQFSFTLLTSVLAGILLGGIPGFCAVMLGDGLGYLVNSMGYPYYWWVALSCAAMALIAGAVWKLPIKKKGGVFVKLALICVLTLVLCSAGINSAGMYFIGLDLYMPHDVLELAVERFGGELNFGVYLVIRFFLLGQIYNSLVNYALLFAIVPLLERLAHRSAPPVAPERGESSASNKEIP